MRGDKVAQSFQEFWTFHWLGTGWLLRKIEQSLESNYQKEENFMEQFTNGQIEKIYQGAVDQLGQSGPGLSKSILDKSSKVDRMLNFLVQGDKLWDKQKMTSRVRFVFTDAHLALEAGELSPQTQAELFPEVALAFNKTVDSWKAEGITFKY